MHVTGRRGNPLQLRRRHAWQRPVAISDKGIVAILIGDRAARLRDLGLALPRARLIPEPAACHETVQRVVKLLDAPDQPDPDLPLDPRGSALQRAVWLALRDIPLGQTVTYGQIAQALPVPATAQDVGTACAANLLAVAVPCHRVIKADGSISGYRWGTRRKRWLLEHEACDRPRLNNRGPNRPLVLTPPRVSTPLTPRPASAAI